ncbi:MAG: hypothetical protein WCT05_11205 [Lentisphaeria bacterium]
MKAKFWDVKEKKSVEADVVEAVRYKNGGYAFKGKTKDGRNLTTFVSKDTYEKSGLAAKACCTKKCSKK